MARFTYFADLENGETLEWKQPIVNGKLQAAKGIDYRNSKDIRGFDKNLGWIKITRVVQMKNNPSQHECDSRCYNASGRTMQCECSCGGKNHGKGAKLICA